MTTLRGRSDELLSLQGVWGLAGLLGWARKQRRTERSDVRAAAHARQYVFIASPGDLTEERNLVEACLAKVAQGTQLKAYRWEDKDSDFSGTKNPQQQLARVSADEISAAVILFSERIGTALPDHMPIPEEIEAYIKKHKLPVSKTPGPGEFPLTGSVFELLDAMQSGKHALLLVKGGEPFMTGTSAEARDLGGGEHRQFLRRKYGEGNAIPEKAAEDYIAQRNFLCSFYDALRRAKLDTGFVKFNSADELKAYVQPWLANVLAPQLAFDEFGRASHGVDPSALKRGLAPLAPEDADIIVGRAHDARSVVTKLLEAETSNGLPFLILAGKPGVGKSSFAGAALSQYLSHEQAVARGRRFPVHIVRPRDYRHLAPSAVLNAVLQQIAPLYGEEQLSREIARHGASMSVASALATFEAYASNMRNRARIATPLLVLDQFEDALAGSTKAFENRWADTLALCQGLAKRHLAWTVIAVEGTIGVPGFVDRLIDTPSMQSAMAQGAPPPYPLGNPTPAEAEQILVRAFTNAGYALEDALKADLLKELAAVRGANDEAFLPLLSLAILYLWEILEAKIDRRADVLIDTVTDPRASDEIDPDEGAAQPTPTRTLSRADLPEGVQSIISEAIERLGRLATEQVALQFGNAAAFDVQMSAALRRLVTLEWNDLRDEPGPPVFLDLSDRDANPRFLDILRQCRLLRRTAQKTFILGHSLILARWSFAADWLSRERRLLVVREHLRNHVRASRDAEKRGGKPIPLDATLASQAHDLLAHWKGASTLNADDHTHLKAQMLSACASHADKPEARDWAAQAIETCDEDFACAELDILAGALGPGYARQLAKGGGSPLVRAVDLQLARTVDTLIAHRAGLAEADGAGFSAFHAAAAGASDEIFLNLVHAAIAQEAKRRGSPDWATGMTQRMARIYKLANDKDWAALATALGERDAVGAVTGLLDSMADPNRWRPLHFAAHRGAHACVAVLLACGANPGRTVDETSTALHVAAANDRVDAIRVLMLGADTQSMLAAETKHDRRTPLQVAAEAGALGAIRALADYPPPPVTGATPLHSAARANRVEAIDLIASLFPEQLNATDRNQRTP
ncbi:MAG: ankyrin repeat domain-containing protein [Hyphomonadaceae bacterium JAD_PAG50586_4]|nr:MAG: ankyrin repeat domain-containing protein [Hyphomonadaceae bacterium JAD_PAG50586_4]